MLEYTERCTGFMMYKKSEQNTTYLKINLLLCLCNDQQGIKGLLRS